LIVMAYDGLSISQPLPGLWAIDDGEVREYLVMGRERALLFDTGAGPGVAEIVSDLTELPLYVVNSHAHEDHIAGNACFLEIYAHPRAIERMPDSSRMRAVWEGDVFDLVGTKLEVIECPGHTAGDIALYDRKRNILLSGDLLQSRPVVLDGSDSDVMAYMQSLRRVRELGGMELRLFPSHGDMPLGIDSLDAVLDCVVDYLSGRGTTEPFHVVLPGVDVWTRLYAGKKASILISADWDNGIR